MRKISGLIGALVLAIGMASCGGDSLGPTCPANTFCLLATSFSPTSLSVPVGTTVTWQNMTTLHNVIWDDAAGAAAAGAGDGTGDMQNFSSPATHTRKFTTAGTFAFHSTIHAGMAATLVVTP